jgi:hypothetical protein
MTDQMTDQMSSQNEWICQKIDEQMNTKTATFNQPYCLSWIGRIWNAMIYGLSKPYEPQVKQKRDRTGRTFYHAYDPVTNRSTYCSDEKDVLIWLEKLY